MANSDLMFGTRPTLARVIRHLPFRFRAGRVTASEQAGCLPLSVAFAAGQPACSCSARRDWSLVTGNPQAKQEANREADPIHRSGGGRRHPHPHFLGIGCFAGLATVGAQAGAPGSAPTSEGLPAPHSSASRSSASDSPRSTQECQQPRLGRLRQTLSLADPGLDQGAAPRLPIDSPPSRERSATLVAVSPVCRLAEERRQALCSLRRSRERRRPYSNQPDQRPRSHADKWLPRCHLPQDCSPAVLSGGLQPGGEPSLRSLALAA